MFKMPVMLRLGAVTLGLVGALSACALEEDFEELDSCIPGQFRCRVDNRVDQCNDNGAWGPYGDFVCVVGACMVMENAPVCM